MITASENQRFVNNGFRPVPSFRILSLSFTPKTQLQQNPFVTVSTSVLPVYVAGPLCCRESVLAQAAGLIPRAREESGGDKGWGSICVPKLARFFDWRSALVIVKPATLRSTPQLSLRNNVRLLETR